MYHMWNTRIQLCLVLLLSVTVYFAAADNTAPTGSVLNLSLRNADIKDVLRGIAMQCGVNIVPDSNVTGNVTIHLQDAPFETGLRTLLETNGYEYENRDGIYLVRAKADTAKAFQMSMKDNNLTVDAEDTNIRQLLRELSRLSGMNVVTESGLTGNVTAHLAGVSVEYAYPYAL